MLFLFMREYVFMPHKQEAIDRHLVSESAMARGWMGPAEEAYNMIKHIQTPEQKRMLEELSEEFSPLG